MTIHVTHIRKQVEITVYKRACPYCKKRPIKKKRTCGERSCQYKHHILLMRKRRKTDQQRPSAQINIS